MTSIAIIQLRALQMDSAVAPVTCRQLVHACNHDGSTHYVNTPANIALQPCFQLSLIEMPSCMWI